MTRIRPFVFCAFVVGALVWETALAENPPPDGNASQALPAQAGPRQDRLGNATTAQEYAAAGTGDQGAVVVTVDGLSFVNSLLPLNMADNDAYLRAAVEGMNLTIPYTIFSLDSWTRDAADTVQAVDDLKILLTDKYDLAGRLNRKLIIVSHSWGTFLAYAALAKLSQDGSVVHCDLFITLGSPLGAPNAHAGPYDLVAEQPVIDFTGYWLQSLHLLDCGCFPNVDQWVNYWAWGDNISGPIDPSTPDFYVDDYRVDEEEFPNLDPHTRYAPNGFINTPKWHKYDSLQPASTPDNQPLLNRVKATIEGIFPPLSLVVRLTSIDPNPVDPFAPVTVAGTATLTRGGPLPSGTATITVGGSTWTASVQNGNFSRPITAPSVSGLLQVTVSSNSLTGNDAAWLTVNPPAGGACYTVGRTTTCADVEDGYPLAPIDERDCFGKQDAEVNAWIELNDVTCPAIRARMYWIRPDGTQQGDPITGQWYYPPPDGWTWWRAATGWTVSGTDILNFPGTWSVRIHVDDTDGFQRVATQSFVLRYDLSEHRTCRAVQDSSPWDCLNPTNTFYQTDAKAYTWAKIDKVSESLGLKWDFWEPNGSLYGSFEDSTDPPPGACWEWYKVPAWINIVGNAAANKCGLWNVKVYIQSPFGQWQPVYTDSFQILEAPPILPTIDVSISPDPPTEGDSIEFHVTASDNTYLQHVEVYWYDGSWHTGSLGEQLYVSTLDRLVDDIGSYSADQQIIYYATATDTSGNTRSSPAKTVVVQARAGACCLPDGSCADRRPQACATEGGIFLGSDTAGSCGLDCDSDLIDDRCAILLGHVEDCNKNGVPDECDCDLARYDANGRISNDCNGNLVPDECEPDSDEDSVPDSCDNCPGDYNWDQLDWDLDGIGDACDFCGFTPFGATTNAFGCSGNITNADRNIDLADYAILANLISLTVPPPPELEWLKVLADLDMDGQLGVADWALMERNLTGPTCCINSQVEDYCPTSSVCVVTNCLDEGSGKVIVEDFADNENPSAPGFDPQFHHSISEARIMGEWWDDGMEMMLLLMSPWNDPSVLIDRVTFQLAPGQAATWASVTARGYDDCAGNSGVSFHGTCASWTEYTGRWKPEVFDTSGLGLGEIVAIDLFSSCIGEYFRIELRVQERP